MSNPTTRQWFKGMINITNWLYTISQNGEVRIGIEPTFSQYHKNKLLPDLIFIYIFSYFFLCFMSFFPKLTP